MSQALNLQINSSPVPRRETLGKPCSTGRLEVYCSLSAGWRAKRTKATRTDSENRDWGTAGQESLVGMPTTMPLHFFFFFSSVIFDCLGVVAISRTMAEDLPFASASDVTERGGGFTLVRGTAFRDDGRNESAVVQVHTAVFRLPVYTDSIQHIQQHTGF